MEDDKTDSYQEMVDHVYLEVLPELPAPRSSCTKTSSVTELKVPPNEVESQTRSRLSRLNIILLLIIVVVTIVCCVFAFLYFNKENRVVETAISNHAFDGHEDSYKTEVENDCENVDSSEDTDCSMDRRNELARA